MVLGTRQAECSLSFLHLKKKNALFSPTIDAQLLPLQRCFSLSLSDTIFQRLSNRLSCFLSRRPDLERKSVSPLSRQFRISFGSVAFNLSWLRKKKDNILFYRTILSLFSFFLIKNTYGVYAKNSSTFFFCFDLKKRKKIGFQLYIQPVFFFFFFYKKNGNWGLLNILFFKAIHPK